MTSGRLQRRVYRAILRLYPAAFRERFSSEMLWIFDETVGEVGMPRLLLDALCSVWKQRIVEEAAPQPAFGLFQALPASSLSLARLTQAAVLALVAVLGFFALLRQSVPLPQPPRTFAVRRSVVDVCGEDKVQHHARVRQALRGRRSRFPD